MPSTGRLDLVANRWEPFVHTIDFEGFDFTGAIFAMQVRLTRDATGDPLVNLSTVGGVGTEGVTITGVATVTGLTTSSISIRINEPTVEGLPFPSERGEDSALYWDMQITPSGGVKYRALEGKFIVHAGVSM